MDDFTISQLTKEIVAAKLRQLPDPCAAAAELVKETLRVALKAALGPAARGGVVCDACQGGMTALLLNEQNLCRGAVAILEAVTALAAELRLDRVELLRWSLRGLADVTRFVRPEMIGQIAAAIESHFAGGGQAFEMLCGEPTGRETPARRR